MTDVKPALAWIENEIDSLRRAPDINGCPMTEDWQQALAALELARAALKARPVTCGECRFSFGLTSQSGQRQLLCTEMGRRGLSESDFCSLGRRRKSTGKDGKL